MATCVLGAPAEDVNLLEIVCHEKTGHENVEASSVKDENAEQLVTGQRETTALCDTVANDLPEGKEYHVFFSYISEDESFVRERVKSLESHPHNLKCCFSQRDFIPGYHIHQNIDNLMNKSLVIVMVLSPDYVKSGWFNQELGIAMTLSTEGRVRIVPLVHKECEIPVTLKSLNYIDETVAEEIDNKIFQAVSTKVGPFTRLPSTQKDVNGCGIWLRAYRSSKHGLSLRFPYPDEQQVAELQDVGAEIDLDVDLKPLIDTMNGHWSLLYDGFLNRSSRHSCFLSWWTAIFISALLQSVVALSLMLAGISTGLIMSITVGMFISLSLVLLCVYPCCMNRWISKEMNRILWKQNLVLYKKCKIIASFTNAPTLQLALVHYNTEPCKNYIYSLLKAKCERRSQNDGDENTGNSPANGDEKNVDTQKESSVDYQKLAADIMDSLVRTYAPTFVHWETLPVSPPPLRHRTKQGKMCLCQLSQRYNSF